ncbi:MAG TPA: hypothetical protein VF950_22565 [Planctomycetota bacterium]
MKWFALLLASVVLLVVAWFLFGPGSAPRGHETTLHLPVYTAEKVVLVESAAQLLKYQPTPSDVDLGARLLVTLHDRLTADEWAPVQNAAFTGWERIKRVPGAQPGIEPIAEELLARFARWSSKEQLAALIRSANANEYWKPQIERGLDRLVKTPISVYRGSSLEAAVSVSIEADDFNRALRMIRRAYWVEGTTEDAKAPAPRIEHVLGLAEKASPDFPKLIAAWAEAPVNAEIAYIAEKVAVRVARSGREAKDWNLTERGMEHTKDLSIAGKFWEAVAWGVAKETGCGIVMEEGTLSALVAGKSYEAAFWEKVQAQTPGNTFPEASWRASCWGRVIRATSDLAVREAAFRKLLAELTPFDPKLSRKAMETWKPIVGEAEAARAFAAVEPAVLQRERELEQLQAKAELDRRDAPLRGELDWLKSQLGSAPSGKLDPQVTANLERRIIEIEKQLSR